MRHRCDLADNSLLAVRHAGPRRTGCSASRKKTTDLTHVFSIYGVPLEQFLGGLVGAPVVMAALLAPYVATGYAFVSMLPLSVLMAGKDSRGSLQ